MENVASYSFMGDLVRDGLTHIHAMWFDIYTGDIYYFSRKRKVSLTRSRSIIIIFQNSFVLFQHFVPIDDNNVEELLSDLDHHIDKNGSNGNEQTSPEERRATNLNTARELLKTTKASFSTQCSCSFCTNAFNLKSEINAKV